jgi:integrase
MLVLAGVDFKTISNRLGHTDIKITLNRYSHVLDEMDRKASENISNIMFN